MFTISFYLLIGALFLCALLLMAVLTERKFLNRKGNNFRWIYYVCFIVLGVISVSTVKKYMYPTNTNVFKNTEYHVLEHKGFKADSVLFLACDYFTDKALWDTKSGVVKITRDSLYISNYCEPLFVEEKARGRNSDGNNHRGNDFVLVNNSARADIEEDGLTVAKSTEEGVDTLYHLTIHPQEDGRVLYVSTLNSSSDTSKFTRPIKQGYPLSDIVAQTAKFDFSEELQELLEGVLIVRERIRIVDNVGRTSTQENKSALTIVPGTNMCYSDGILVNGKPVENRSYAIPYNCRTLLFSGIGRTKTDIYSLSYNEEDRKLELRYVLPKMQALREDGGRLFLTSSVDAILEDSKDGGYYYNLFENEKNFNHINAELRYVSGTSRENMKFQVIDVYSQDPSLKLEVGADEEFELCVHAGSESTRWIFDVKDLRATNPLKFHNIFIFIFGFIFLVGIRIVIDSYSTPRTLSFIELSAYIAILCLCVVRLILGWRSSTFVPIEDISPSVFLKMRASIIHTAYLAWAFPLGVIFLSARKRVWESLCYCCNAAQKCVAVAKCQDKCMKVKDKFLITKIGIKLKSLIAQLVDLASRKPDELVLLGFLISLVMCFGLARGSLERVFNIPMPLLLYILFDYWLVKLQDEYKDAINVVKERIVLAILAFCYLFVQDAGFTIIFLVYFALLHFVFGVIVGDNVSKGLLGNKIWSRHLRNHNFRLFLLSLVGAVILYFILANEGALMIGLFNNISIIFFIVCIIVAGVLTALVVMSKTEILTWILILTALAVCGIGLLLFSESVWLALICLTLGVLMMMRVFRLKSTGVRIASSVVALAVIGAGVFEMLPATPSPVAEVANSKVHMKYRAEVQKLDKDEKIDDLIVESKYDSDDIIFIMRSAHNQWFINQYIQAGEKMRAGLNGKKTYFSLQPHSNQGSTYTTQTTDLVITRYVLAEHGNFVVIMFMAMFLLLILIYSFEVKLRDNRKRVILGALVLLFVVALMVVLSATNRIVFIGQDFPFISIQSIVAVFFPLALIFLAVWAVNNDKQESSYISSSESKSSKLFMTLSLVIFSVISLWGIRQQGKNQNEDQFDVSKVIQNIAQKVDLLDRSFVKFQRATKTNMLPKDELWEAYTHNDEYSTIWKDMIQNDSSEFYRGLLGYFDSVQVVKNDPNELLHMRRRNDYWHLSLNKKHYFIPSVLESSLQWEGDLLAAASNRSFYFKTTKGLEKVRLESNSSFDKNILPSSIQQKVENVKVTRFDESWSANGEPIILIYSNQAKGRQAYFDIESEEGSITGGAEHQMATLIKNGDMVVIKNLEHGEAKDVLAWRYGRDSDNYLAKNIWMNGSQRLFYPLGKESMWSYQFANVVSNAFGKDAEYRDDSLRISIDYDLHKRFYEILSTQNLGKVRLRESDIQILQAFEELDYNEMRNKNNISEFYFDVLENKVKCQNSAKARDAVLRKVLLSVNNLIAKDREASDMRDKIVSAIDNAIERKFDFSAVVLDGNGRIRLLFDHTKSRSIDPNNIRYFNKFISDMYKNGDNKTERDAFGNKALQILPSGPGSTFKPIAYTAVTSQENLAWNNLVMQDDYFSAARTKKKANKTGDKSPRSVTYYYYGGVNMEELGQPLSIDNLYTKKPAEYLIHSNNLYHSAIIMMGMQQKGEVLNVFKPAGNDVMSFPVMEYNGRRVSFNPDVWYADGTFEVGNGILDQGLFENFNLQGDLVNERNRYANYFGEGEEFKLLFNEASFLRAWTYAETGSMNVYDRRLNPKIRNGFNQMLLGAYPLEVTPLQMAEIGMRLTSLNKAPNITTLDDSKNTIPQYDFFNVDSWGEDDAYHRFHQKQVLAQMKQVPICGTASALKEVSRNLMSQGYHLYAKTGTLNDERAGSNKNSRIKHLLVIISNKALESVANVDELRNVRYYVLYLSYMGVQQGDFNNGRYRDMIEAVVKSEQFKNYMQGE